MPQFFKLENASERLGVRHATEFPNILFGLRFGSTSVVAKNNIVPSFTENSPFSPFSVFLKILSSSIFLLGCVEIKFSALILELSSLLSCTISIVCEPSGLTRAG